MVIDTQVGVGSLLKVLRAAGLVESERYRQWVYRRLRPDALAALAEVGGLAAGARRGDERRRPCC